MLELVWNRIRAGSHITLVSLERVSCSLHTFNMTLLLILLSIVVYMKELVLRGSFRFLQGLMIKTFPIQGIVTERKNDIQGKAIEGSWNHILLSGHEEI